MKIYNTYLLFIIRYFRVKIFSWLLFFNLQVSSRLAFLNHIFKIFKIQKYSYIYNLRYSLRRSVAPKYTVQSVRIMYLHIALHNIHKYSCTVKRHWHWRRRNETASSSCFGRLRLEEYFFAWWGAPASRAAHTGWTPHSCSTHVVGYKRTRRSSNSVCALPVVSPYCGRRRDPSRTRPSVFLVFCV